MPSLSLCPLLSLDSFVPSSFCQDHDHEPTAETEDPTSACKVLKLVLKTKHHRALAAHLHICSFRNSSHSGGSVSELGMR